jgi:thiosulfate/3-mercaptopyruvate sulfurtransferase
VLVFDCSFDLANPDAGEQAYAAGHIPGARYLHLDRDLSGTKTGKNGRHPLPDRDALVATLASHGLKQGQQVVAYDAQGAAFAARLWWLLRWLGHDSVAVLDGGLQAWQAAGQKLETATPPAPAKGDFKAGAPLAATVDVQHLIANLKTGEQLVVDARSPDRYRGENETIDPVAGHIPGAVNRFFKDNLTADGRFKSAHTLRNEFGAVIGQKQPEHVVLQCGSGATACHNALAMEVAGLHGALVYVGSWSEWCADPSRPVATGPNP